MQNKNNRSVILALCAALIAISGCSTHRALENRSANVTAAPVPTLAPSDRLLPIVPPVAAAEDDVLPWTRYTSFLDLPDPDHQTLEADDSHPINIAAHHADGAHPHAIDGQPADLWDRIRAGYTLPSYDNSRVRAELGWYVDHPNYLARSVERARPYLRFIADELQQRGMPLEIALLPIVESAYQPFAYSHGRAAGLWQFIPSTANLYGLRQNWWYDGRRDVVASTRAALDYLQFLGQYFDGDWLLALAAYNSGEGTVKRAVDINAAKGKPTDFWSLKLPRETRAYVPKLLALAELFGNPESYSFDLASIPDAPAITQVDIGSQIEIAKAAELADLSTEEFYRLNPAFNRWATDPDGPHQLLLPVDKVDDFTARLSALDPDDRVTWARHTVQRGETLGHIAKRYGVSVSVLKQINDLNGHVVRAGANLIVPSGGRPQPTAVAATGSSSAAAEPKRITHVVRNGDTLWTISRSHGIDMEKLAEWNTLSPDDILRPGQRLIIWKTEPVASNESDGYQLAGPALPVRDMIRRINYVVRRGDSLTRISQRFNVSVADLRKWNSLGRKHALRPGQSLTLYVDVTRQTANL